MVPIGAQYCDKFDQSDGKDYGGKNGIVEFFSKCNSLSVDLTLKIYNTGRQDILHLLSNHNF